MDIRLRLIIGGLILLILSGLGTMLYSRGYHSRDVEVAMLNEKFVEIDKETKETVKKQEVVTNEITKQYEDDKSVLISYYSDRLRHTRGQACTSTITDSTKGTDGTTTEPDSSGPSFEASCALDALKVIKLQDFLKQNNFPIGE